MRVTFLFNNLVKSKFDVLKQRLIVRADQIAKLGAENTLHIDPSFFVRN